MTTSSEEAVRREPLVSELIDALDSACATQQEQHHARDALIKFVRNSMAEISTQAHGAQIVRENFDAVVAERDEARADNLRNHNEKVDQYTRAQLLEAERDKERAAWAHQMEKRIAAERERDDAVIERDRLRQRVSELSAALAALFGSRNAFTGHLASAYMCNPSCETQARKEAVDMARLALSGEK